MTMTTGKTPPPAHHCALRKRDRRHRLTSDVSAVLEHPQPRRSLQRDEGDGAAHPGRFRTRAYPERNAPRKFHLDGCPACPPSRYSGRFTEMTVVSSPQARQRPSSRWSVKTRWIRSSSVSSASFEVRAVFAAMHETHSGRSRINAVRNAVCSGMVRTISVPSPDRKIACARSQHSDRTEQRNVPGPDRRHLRPYGASVAAGGCPRGLSRRRSRPRIAGDGRTELTARPRQSVNADLPSCDRAGEGTTRSVR
jgi:hypothetical protein